MQPYCRHRAEQALQAYWGRAANLRESATLVTALQNPQSPSAHVFLMETLEMNWEQAHRLYAEHAPDTCRCDPQPETAYENRAVSG